MKIQDINERVGVQITSYMDKNPKKASVSMVYLERVGEEVIAEVNITKPDGYSPGFYPQRFDIDQKWLDERDVKQMEKREFAREYFKIFAQNEIIQQVSGKEAFHQASFFKHDIDAKGHLPLDSSERLHIAKLNEPFALEMENGKSINITHISNIGELIYKAQGLKSVPFEQASLNGLDKLAAAIIDSVVSFAPELESHLTRNKEKPLLREVSGSPSLSM